MRVRVENALHGDLADVGAEERAGELSRALRVHPVTVLDLDAVDPLHHEDAVAHVRMDHLRHEEVFAVLRDHRRDQLCVVRLLAEVQLAVQVLLELVRERVQLQQLCGPGMLLGDRRRLPQELEVERDLLDDPRPAHLDDDLAPALQQRGVDLADRRARKRLLVDRREMLETDVFRDRLPERRERKRRDVVDELAELVDVDVREQVRPRREQLAELDERRPELLERFAEANGALTCLRLVADDAHLAQHAEQVRTPRDRGQLESPLDLSLVSHPRSLPASPGLETNRPTVLKARCRLPWERAKSVRATTLTRAVPETSGMTELAGDDRDHDQREQHECAPTEEILCHREHLPSSETEILERLGRAAVEHRCPPFVSTLGGQVALRDPCSSAVRSG